MKDNTGGAKAPKESTTKKYARKARRYFIPGALITALVAAVFPVVMNQVNEQLDSANYEFTYKVVYFVQDSTELFQNNRPFPGRVKLTVHSDTIKSVGTKPGAAFVNTVVEESLKPRTMFTGQYVLEEIDKRKIIKKPIPEEPELKPSRNRAPIE